MKIYFVLPVFLLSLTSCEKKEDPVRIPEELAFTDSRKAAGLIESGTKFGFGMFSRILETTDAVGKNIMVSPLSVSMALGMTYNGAEGETRTAFEQTFGLSGLTREEINGINQQLMKYLIQADPDVVLEIANSIWYRKEFPVLPSFIEINKLNYEAEVKDLDFNLPSAKDVINNWVSSKTHGKIQGIVDEIPAEAVMYLINALYFNGTWKYNFVEKNSYDGTFTREDMKMVPARYMTMEASVNYLRNDIFSAVELPYGNEKFSMIFIVPAQGKTISDLVSTIDLERYNAIVSGLTPVKVRVNIPRFKFDFMQNLNQVLTDMGLGVAFTDLADFTGINPDGNLLISKVLHKTFIDVNEKGTEAAAVTSVEISFTSVNPDPPVFNADKPFIFIIREKSSNALLFMGKVGQPQYQ